MKTTHIRIPNLYEFNTATHIEKALESIPGVRSAAVQTHPGRASIDHEDADEQALAAAVQSVGYDAEIDSPAS
jgi:copper chaperone CopZ